MIAPSFVLLFALFIGLSTEKKVKLRAKQGDCVHQYSALTIVEQTCTMMRTGLVRFNPACNSLQVCHNRHWAPYSVAKPNPSPSPNRTSLIGHWKMDEETGIYVDDDSGHENHGIASGGPTTARGKFSRGRCFSSAGLIT
ncbi:uncharacterized protein LOC110243972, partial [Exaiptasia diaphana]|uniref:Secreted protein n=1 Tax=Exaiptasia diaphana TaxID=2652724 RepID=A0A913XKU7_EXADI